MLVNGKHYRTLWPSPQEPQTLQVIDQRLLPFEFKIVDLKTSTESGQAIKEMLIRGAGLIGAVAGFAMWQAVAEAKDGLCTNDYIVKRGNYLKETRPTAVNLAWAVDRQIEALKNIESYEEKKRVAFDLAMTIANEDALACEEIGRHGLKIIEEIAKKKNGKPVNILTHCNAGWLAFVDFGSATAPIYLAHKKNIPIHVWVDETRPRNQGARLTAWELGEQGVPHTIIADNVGGHLMQHGMVDLVIVGSDRTTRSGDVANKIGTYLKALAAFDNDIPFYAAMPTSTIDWNMTDGLKEIPIETRSENEVKYMEGSLDGNVKEFLITPKNSRALNYGFDVTPSRLVTGIITEKGIKYGPDFWKNEKTLN